eukprot:14148-Heterococcus_DN1.PRE.1
MPVTPVTPVKQKTSLHEYCISRLVTQRALSILLLEKNDVWRILESLKGCFRARNAGYAASGMLTPVL